MENGLIHIYCGNGKGKTTAVIGLTVRALGANLKVLYTQFLKTSSISELKILRAIKGITLSDSPASLPFYFKMSEKEKEKYNKYALNLFHSSLIKAAEGDYDLLVLDEILPCIDLNIISKEEVLTFLNFKPKKLEVALTGRNVDEDIVSIADYVSRIEAVKHPYERGEVARIGIEY